MAAWEACFLAPALLAARRVLLDLVVDWAAGFDAGFDAGFAVASFGLVASLLALAFFGRARVMTAGVPPMQATFRRMR